ncbi:hypothetical protein Glove_256g23 [Diversispora epigaea]|uniref:RING-type domain-containing protein n=1 Tax=Diversispora epigaea TaxID=1348612 RepID=A0A397I9Y0_9GLOM|nr:hypothetical protein Glove_256g23 [Diversispora epigaea]
MNNFKRKVDEITSDNDNEKDVQTSRKKKVAKNERRKGKADEREETRLAPYKHVCNKYTRLRMERAMTEYIYLIDCKEINSTKREYMILGPAGSLFVFLKALKVDSNSKLIYQKALLTNELKSIFNRSPRIILPSKSFVEQLKDQIQLIKKNKRKPIDGKCPICLELMNKKEKLVWCQSRCGNNIHEECFNLWKQRKPEVTCVYCQTEWKDLTLPPPPPLNAVQLQQEFELAFKRTKEYNQEQLPRLEFHYPHKLHRSETRGVADYQVRLFIALIIASPIIVSAGRVTYSSFSHSDDAGTDNNNNTIYVNQFLAFTIFLDVYKDESSNGLDNYY